MFAKQILSDILFIAIVIRYYLSTIINHQGSSNSSSFLTRVYLYTYSLPFYVLYMCVSFTMGDDLSDLSSNIAYWVRQERDFIVRAICLYSRSGADSGVSLLYLFIFTRFSPMANILESLSFGRIPQNFHILSPCDT